MTDGKCKECGVALHGPIGEAEEQDGICELCALERDLRS